MRLSAWIPRFGSVSAAIVLLAGCAAASVNPVTTLPQPSILVRPGRAGFVVAAHAERGAGVTAIAREIAEHTAFGLVLATPAQNGDATRGLDPAYERAATEAARGPLRLLVELREGDRAACVGPMAIGTVGVDAELAKRLRALAELIRDAHLRANPEIPRLAIVVDGGGETVVEIRARMVAASLAPERALSIELPPCVRRDWRELYGAVLADFVAQAAALPAGR
jgi:hypothetical protein